MQDISFLNLEYIFVAFYRAIHGIAPENIPSMLVALTDVIEKVGVVAALLFLIGIIYTHIRIEQIHHKAHAKRHEETEKVLGHHSAVGGGAKNPRWEHILSLMTSASPSDWRQAIMEADIILSELLDHFSIPGETIGEKLKVVDRGSFTTLDLAWDAHRVRNEVAHGGSSFELSEREARRTIDLFRQVFEEFGYI